MVRDISAAYGLSLNSAAPEHIPEDFISEQSFPSNPNSGSDEPGPSGQDSLPICESKSLSLDEDCLGQDCPDDNAQVTLAALKPGPLLTVELVTEFGSYIALIDTGASVSLMRESVAAECGGAVRDQSSFSSVLGLGGNTIESVSSINLNFLIHSIDFTSKFMVVPNESLTYDIVLGGDFYTSYGLIIDFNKRKISRTTDSGSWEIYLDETPATVYRDLPVYLLDDVKLNSSEPILVNAEVTGLNFKVDPTHEFYYDGLVDSKLGRGIVGYQGLVNVKDGKTSLLLESYTYGSEKRLKSGTRLGTLSTIVEIPEVNSVVEEPLTSFLEDVDLKHLPFADIGKVVQMLKGREAVFSKGDSDIGCTGLTQCKIELTDHTPIRFKPRSFPEPVANEIERQCDELLKLGVIEFSRSPYSAPVLPVVKKDSTIRMCLDYRALNRVTKADRFPVPNMGDLVFGLGGTEYFTSLDLVKGYYQVPLHPDSYEYTAFSTARNHYHFKRLSFGLKNAPGAFQREMQEILKEFDTKQVVVYIDDILIMSRNFKEHVELVDAVLGALIRHGVKIKPSKCTWFKHEVEFLGHNVGRDGITKSDKYIKDVVDFPKPSNVKELRSFLGLVNFQRKFIPQCSIVCKPLTKLMGSSDKSKILWNAEMTEAFDRLKEFMAEDIKLSYPDYNPTAPLMELSTDASKFGAGACLTQVQSDHPRVIAYSSTTFNKAQINYSVIEQELGAIRWALGSMRGFLFGVPFTLYTDHRPLVYMHNMRKTNARILRTWNDLSEFDFEVKYRLGKENFIADTLSRLHTPDWAVGSDSLVGDAIPEGLQVITQVEGGGDSLIQSLLIVLSNHRGQHDPKLKIPNSDLDLRGILVDEILANPERYNLKLDKAARQNLKFAKLCGTCPPDEFFLAFTYVYGLQIWVHHGMIYPVVHSKVGERATTDPSQRVHLQCKSGIHYNPMGENKLFKELDVPCDTVPEDISDILYEDMDDPIVDVNFDCLPEPKASDCHCQSRKSVARVVVELGLVRCCGLVDTGAQVSLVSERVWKNFQNLTAQMQIFHLKQSQFMV